MNREDGNPNPRFVTACYVEITIKRNFLDPDGETTETRRFHYDPHGSTADQERSDDVDEIQSRLEHIDGVH